MPFKTTTYSARFTIPLLPKEWYSKLVELQKGLGFPDGNNGQWQMVIAALMATCALGSIDSLTIGKIAEEVRTKYPIKVKVKKPYDAT